jgi:hypothetical protein
MLPILCIFLCSVCQPTKYKSFMTSVKLVHVSAPGCLPQGVVSLIVLYDLEFLSDLMVDVLKLRLEEEVSSPTSILSTWLCGFQFQTTITLITSVTNVVLC